MNVKEYISSGIVESYVLGLATDQERAEFEKFCAQYPEAMEARIAFEQQLEQAAVNNAITPSAGLKERVWDSIQNTEAKIVQFSDSKAPVQKTNWLKYAAAACLLLLAGSTYWNYSLYNRNKQLTTEKEIYSARLASIDQELKIMSAGPQFKIASMKGMEAAPQALTTIYWDTTSHDVYILVNNLPKPATDKQYQIWALLDGRPIDLGLIDNEFFVTQKRLLVKAKNVQNAQAFAITLENKGGNTTPKGKMIVLGNL